MPLFVWSFTTFLSSNAAKEEHQQILPFQDDKGYKAMTWRRMREGDIDPREYESDIELG